jgi:hypothetical protein
VGAGRGGRDVGKRDGGSGFGETEGSGSVVDAGTGSAACCSTGGEFAECCIAGPV